MVDGQPGVIVKRGFVVGGGGLNRIAPRAPVVGGAGNGHLLTPHLVAEGIGQAAVIDLDSAAGAERAITATGGSPIKRRVAAGGAPDRGKPRQVAAAPSLAVVGREVVARGRRTRGERTGAA